MIVVSRAPRRPSLGLTAIFVGAVLAGCAALTPKAPEDVVKELATKRWQALVAGDFSAAYDHAVPSYRKIKSREEYVAMRRGGGMVKWLAASVIRVKCEDARCKTTTELTSKPLIPGFKGTLKAGIEETWVLEDGRWWFVESL